MKMKKLNSTLLIVILSVSSLYSEPCPTCVSTILKQSEHKTTTSNKFKVAKTQDSSNQYTNNGLIALDDNEDDSIVITLDNIENNISSDTKKLYACSDDMTKTLICDDETKVCECV